MDSNWSQCIETVHLRVCYVVFLPTHSVTWHGQLSNQLFLLFFFSFSPIAKSKLHSKRSRSQCNFRLTSAAIIPGDDSGSTFFSNRPIGHMATLKKSEHYICIWKIQTHKALYNPAADHLVGHPERFPDASPRFFVWFQSKKLKVRRKQRLWWLVHVCISTAFAFENRRQHNCCKITVDFCRAQVPLFKNHSQLWMLTPFHIQILKKTFSSERCLDWTGYIFCLVTENLCVKVMKGPRSGAVVSAVALHLEVCWFDR